MSADEFNGDFAFYFKNSSKIEYKFPSSHSKHILSICEISIVKYIKMEDYHSHMGNGQ